MRGLLVLLVILFHLGSCLLMHHRPPTLRYTQRGRVVLSGQRTVRKAVRRVWIRTLAIEEASEQSHVSHCSQSCDDDLRASALTAANATAAVVGVEPVESGINPVEKALEDDLLKKIESLNDELRRLKLSLSEVREQRFEKGKSGVHLMQAKIKDTLKNQSAEELALVAEKRREVFEQIKPIIDNLEAVSQRSSATTEREVLIHNSFDTLQHSLRLLVEQFDASQTPPQQ